MILIGEKRDPPTPNEIKERRKEELKQHSSGHHITKSSEFTNQDSRSPPSNMTIPNKKRDLLLWPGQPNAAEPAISPYLPDAPDPGDFEEDSEQYSGSTVAQIRGEDEAGR